MDRAYSLDYNFPPQYTAYVLACIADGVKPLSYTAWVNLMPLGEAEF